MERNRQTSSVFSLSLTLLFAITGLAPTGMPSSAWAVPSDPAPDAITRDTHYWTSNETRLDLFYEDVASKGGVYVGVGTDQNFVLAAWAQAERLVLMDFDAAVVGLHDAYRVAFIYSETPEELLAWWSKSARTRFRRQMKAHYKAEPKRRRAALKAHFTARYVVEKRLRWLRETFAPKRRATFMTDPAQFTYIKNLFQNGRVTNVRGDLTQDRTLRTIGRLAREAGETVRVLYLSNAEQYFPFHWRYRRNIKALPFDEQSVVVRTSGLKNLRRVPGTYYNYSTQRGLGLQQWLAQKRAKSAVHMLYFAEPTPQRGYLRLNAGPATAKAEKRAAKARLAQAAETPSDAMTKARDEPPNAHPPGAADDDSALPCPEGLPDGMACIPGGSFLRGSDSRRHKPARPQASVWLDTYLMDIHEVTYAAYKACEKTGRCKKAGPNYRDFDASQQPINGVSWYAANQFCRAQGKHLPTEAEWEKAARGTDGRLYPWGDDKATCKRAVIKDARGRSCGKKQKSRKFADVGRPEPVGTKPPNDFGLYDMAGNSWEWVADWYTDSYTACGKACRGKNPRGACAGKKRCRGNKKVVRGGSWYWPAAYATTVYRRAHHPWNRPFHHFGFRCAATLDQARSLSATPTP